VTTPPAVSVNGDLCIGSGSCVHLAPGAFILDARGVAEPVDPGTVSIERLLRAARSCPTAAITIDLVAD
jgi:ferredoxin